MTTATEAHTRKIGMVELTIAMLVSGTVGVFVIESGSDPFTVTFFRCVFGVAALGLYCWVRGYLKNTGLTRKTLLLALVGGVFLVFNWAFLFLSLSMTSISLATVVYHTQPFYVVMLGAIVFRDRITSSKIAWIALAFVGFLFVTDLSNLLSSPGYGLGVLYALLAAVLYAFATIIAKWLKGIRPHIIALIQVSVGIPLLLPFVDFGSVPQAASGWAWLVGIGVIHTCLQYILMYSSYQKLETPVIAVLSFVYPAMAIVVDMAVYGTFITPGQATGIGLIVFASLATSLGWALPGTGKPSSESPSPDRAAPTAETGDRSAENRAGGDHSESGTQAPEQDNVHSS